MSDVAPWLREHMDAWEDALADLRGDGWEVAMTCVAAPVQLEGRTPTGERFYFRSRHEDVSLQIGAMTP